MTSILVTTPAFGGNVCAETVSGLVELAGLAARKSVDVAILIDPGSAPIALARNKLAGVFMHDDRFTHQMWIDADVGFRGADVFELLSLDLPIVAGLYPRRDLICPEPPVRALDGGPLKIREDGTAIAKDVGMGFALVTREVYRKVDLRGFAPSYVNDSDHPDVKLRAYFDTGIIEGGYLSEDYWFCRSVRKAGFDVVIDTRRKLTHVGRHVYASP